MTTPEEFLVQSDALAQMVEAMRPMFKMVAEVKEGFVAEGISPEVAEAMSFEWYKQVLLPVAVSDRASS